MNILELKGEMLELISEVKNPSVASQLLKIIREFIAQEIAPGYLAEPDEFEENMSDWQIAELERAIEMSYDEKNLVPHETAKQMYEQWQKQNRPNG